MDRVKLEFSKSVLSDFLFLVEEYGFSCISSEKTYVRYESDKVFVNIFHGRVSFEIGLQVGLLSSESSTGYGLGSVIAFTDPELGNKYRRYMTSTQEGVKKGVREIAKLLKTYGDKALRGDSAMFQWLNDDVEKYWAEREAAQIRPKAIEAFRAKDYSKAFDLYKSIEGCLTSAEKKN